MKKKKINLSLRKFKVAHLNNDMKTNIKGGNAGCDIIGGTQQSENKVDCISNFEIDGPICIAQ